MNKRVVFIAGASHSGSTLIGCILGSSADNPFRYFHVGEMYAYFTPTHQKYGQSRGVAGFGKKFWDEINYSVDSECAYWEVFARSGAEVLIDSSKNIEWLRKQCAACRKNGWNLQVVVAFRSFGRLFASGIKRGNRNHQNIDNLMYYPRLFSELCESDVGITVIDTSRLVDHPVDMTRKLCERTGIPYVPGKEEYWNFQHYHLYGASMQRRQLREPELAGFHESAGDESKYQELRLSAGQKQRLEWAETQLRRYMFDLFVASGGY